MMVPGYGLLGRAILIVLALWWCKEIIQRLPKDLKEMFGESDWTTKGVIVLFWGLTGVIVMLLWRFGSALVRPILDYL
ncbi:MAG: hypothetical protein KC931_16135 [Candidatus Omnitrophica bacterium]|nr:hypothetical protein [Candidatus Omnitrophota bacterium]